MRKLLLITCLICICLSISGCGNPKIDISKYKEETLTITGITNEPVTFSIEELEKMELTTQKTESTSDKIGEVRATGPTLNTILEAYNVTQEDFKKIKITAADEYEVTIEKYVYEGEELILAFGINGEPLEEESEPLRLIIPNSNSAYWIRMIEKIELIK